jgi:Fe-Mn family superoxide dismutase
MYTLPALPYAYDALEPYFDAATMQLHHDKHHQTYLDKLNDALKDQPALSALPAEQLVRELETTVPAELRPKVRNFGGGYVNHTFFWEILAPQAGGEPTGVLAEAIVKNFESFAKFKEQFEAAAASVFGSGWAWLVKTADGSLKIITTPNQDSPLTQGLTPVVGLDVWEHAYYLKYQNRRPEFIAAFWQVINWQAVTAKFSA